MTLPQPWLDNKNWADNAIPSDARRGHRVAWGFALVVDPFPGSLG